MRKVKISYFIYLKSSKNFTTKVAHLVTRVLRDEILIIISLKSLKNKLGVKRFKFTIIYPTVNDQFLVFIVLNQMSANLM